MSHDSDYRYALELQKRLNAEESDDDDIKITDFKSPTIVSKQKLQMVPKRSNPHSNLDEEFLNRTQNLVHPMWETLDPTPDVTALFGAFDMKFFQNRLKCVTLEWSKRMYQCAGICYSAKNRFGMAITIRLSEPLLKLRPRKDLVETLLHEMIHAYCFVLNIREGNGGHGPQFKKIMQAINKVAGTNITVYHTFHDEVNLYKQHWWRCNGICQNRSPFFGYVKRTCNRAPGPNDQWWAAHQESCGGTFMKIKEPEKPQKKKAGKPISAPPGSKDIRSFFGNNDNNSNNKNQTTKNPNNGGFKNSGNAIGGFKGPVKTNGGGTLLLNPRTKPNSTTSIAKEFPPTSYPGLSSDPFNTNMTNNATSTHNPKAAVGGNLRNVVGFGDLNRGSSPAAGTASSSKNEMTGRGFTVGATNSPSATDGAVDRQRLREIWTKRFDKTGSTESKDPYESSSKRPRRHSADEDKRNDNNSNWKKIDDDIMLCEEPIKVFTLSSDEETEDLENDECEVNPPPKTKPLTAAERQTAIKQEIMDETMDNLADEDIILIDDEYDDNMNDDITVATELADTSVIDEFFGEDTLLKDFLIENDVRPTFSRHVADPQSDIVTCPVCQNKLKRHELEAHLDGCTGITVKILPPKSALKKLATVSREIKPKRTPRPNKKDVLRAAGYTEEDLANITLSSTEDEFDLSSLSANTSSPNIEEVELSDSVRGDRMRSIYKTTRQCPVCACEIEESIMNDHLDLCLL